MKILYLFPQLPFPPESGGRIITYEYVKHFLREHEVWIASLKHRPEDDKSAEVLKEMGSHVILVDAPPRVSLFTLFRSILSKKPYKAHRFYSKRLAEELSGVMATVSFDVIHAQNFYMAQYIRGSEKARKVHYKENYEGLLLERYASTLGNPVRRFFWKNEARKTTWLELELAKRFDRLLCISPVDAERLKKRAPGTNWKVLPATIDADMHQFRPKRGDSKRLLFLGMLNYFPNVDGAEFFLEEVFPSIREEVCDVELDICGHSPGNRIRKLGEEPGVNVVGPIRDVQKALEKCAVFVIPLRIGGGVRLKLLQCLATGTPVVSTSIGCEGIEVQHGREILIADEPKEFARCVARLLKDSELRTRLTRAGRELFENKYAPSIVLKELEKSYSATEFR